jgi:hypothetical protein
MRERRGTGLVEWLGRALVGDYLETTVRLEQEIEQLKRTLDDPDVLRPLVTEALHRQAEDAPTALAAALTPLLDELLRQRSLSDPQQTSRRYWPWLSLLTATGTAGLLLLSWRGPAAMVSAATERVPASAGAHAAVSPGPSLDEHAAGVFGLGHAELRDEELAHTVRERLGACEQLTDATVTFSVKDGWVWLRGHASASGRDAADRALADLGAGVVVVNQLYVVSSTVMADG